MLSRPKAYIRRIEDPEIAKMWIGFRPPPTQHKYGKIPYPIEISLRVEGLDPRHSEPSNVRTVLSRTLRQVLPDVQHREGSLIDLPTTAMSFNMITYHVLVYDLPIRNRIRKLQQMLVEAGYDVELHQVVLCRGKDRVGSILDSDVGHGIPTKWKQPDLCWNHATDHCEQCGNDICITEESNVTKKAGTLRCPQCYSVLKNWKAGELLWTGFMVRDNRKDKSYPAALDSSAIERVPMG